jgi:hypothetical protein
VNRTCGGSQLQQFADVQVADGAAGGFSCVFVLLFDVIESLMIEMAFQEFWGILPSN